MAERKKRITGRLVRSEVLSIRLDSRLRYLAELAARKQRRAVSSFVEWAVQDSLNRVFLQEDRDSHRSVAEEASILWDVDEADRFVKLALRYPDLLTHDEQVLWKVIRETGYVWKGQPDQKGRWVFNPSEDTLVMGHLRKYWEDFKKVARGEADRSILPKGTG